MRYYFGKRNYLRELNFTSKIDSYGSNRYTLARMQNNGNNRGFWTTRLGFILAASGSAIGLGNVWKFPYLAGQHGGGAFLFIYLICAAVIGIPIMLGEFTIGRKTNLNPVGAFRSLSSNPLWTATGYMGVLAGFLILSFYGVVGGWTLAYIVKSLTAEITHFSSPKEAKEYFGLFIANPWEAVFYQFLFMVFCVGIVIKGIHGGIEKACDIMMPTLVLMLAILMIRSLTLKSGVR